MTGERPRRIGLFWALGAAAGSAFMAIPWKLANGAGSAEHAVFVLLFTAAVGNTGLLAWQQRGARRALSRIDIGVAAGLAGFTLLGNHLSALAVQDMSPAIFNLILRSELPLTALAAWALLRERVGMRFWLGTAIAITGIFLLQAHPRGALSGTTPWTTLIAITSAGCFAALAVTTRAFVHRIDLIGVNAIRLWFAVGLWFLFNEPASVTTIPAAQWAYATVAAVGGPFLGRLMLMQSARTIEAGLSTLVMLLAPVLTLLPAFVFLDEWPAPHELFGGAVVLVGIAFPLWEPRTR